MTAYCTGQIQLWELRQQEAYLMLVLYLKKTQFIDLIQYLNHKLSFGDQSSVVEFGG